MYLEPNNPFAQKIIKACYPSYNGRLIKAVVRDGGMNLNSYWDGGSRSYFQLYRLDTGENAGIPQNGTMFDKIDLSGQTKYPCENVAVVEHSIFCGKDAGITIHLHPANGALYLPDKPELSREEKIVLVATRSYKSTYAGISNYRFREAREQTGITAEAWENAKQSCITRGFLNKAGAITYTGKNAVDGMWNLRSLKEEK
ncbi:MAG: hypothetical protein KGL39_41120 [Patescibacteria group bacterium]|nr:hypothetical protein [Patescibacteria group bacterium]